MSKKKKGELGQHGDSGQVPGDFGSTYARLAHGYFGTTN